MFRLALPLFDVGMGFLIAVPLLWLAPLALLLPRRPRPPRAIAL